MLGGTPNRNETDDALTAMSHSFRRRLLFELYEEVNRTGGKRVNYDHIELFRSKSARLELFHNHLPKLESEEYIGWNKAERTIRTGPRWGEIEPLLDVIHMHLNELPPTLRGIRLDSERAVR